MNEGLETKEQKIQFLVDVIEEVIGVLLLVNKTKKDERVSLLIDNLKHCVSILDDESFDDINKSISLFGLVKSFIKTILFIK